MFDLGNSNAHTRSSGQAMPPTPAHAWPLLGAAAGASRRGQAREPHADRRLQGARRAGLSRPAEARAPEYARDHLGHARQSRPEPRFRGRPPRRSGDDLRAARQFGREEPRHARVRRRARRAWRGFSGGARGSRAPRRVRRTPHGAVVPSAISCSASPPTRSNCCALRRISTCSTCRSGRARASAAASWRATCLG